MVLKFFKELYSTLSPKLQNSLTFLGAAISKFFSLLSEKNIRSAAQNYLHNLKGFTKNYSITIIQERLLAFIFSRRSLKESLSSLSGLLLFSLFSLFIGYIFYNRLLRERLPKDLSIPVDNIQKAIYLCILVVNIFILILLLWEKYKAYRDEVFQEAGISVEVNTESILYRLKLTLSKYIFDVTYKISLIYMSFIYPAWQDEYHRFVIAFYIRFNELPDKVKEMYFYVILVIPKVIVAVIFLLDVLVFHELNLFYSFLWLLLIPLIFRFICYNYQIIICNTIDLIWLEMNNDPHRFQGTQGDIHNFISNLPEEDIETLIGPAKKAWEQEESSWYKKILPKLQQFISDLREKSGIELYTYNVTVYILLGNLGPTMNQLDTIKEKIKFVLNIMLRICYIIGWAMIITLNKNNHAG